MRPVAIAAALMLAACEQPTQPEGNAAVVANIAEQAAEKCALPRLALPDGAQLQSTLLNETTANFRTAFGRACAKGLLADKPLIDPRAADQRLFLLNAPEANGASIYFSSIDGDRMLLQYPFLTADGKTQVPSAAELEEAIHCAVRGATAQEQESTGRCLVD